MRETHSSHCNQLHPLWSKTAMEGPRCRGEPRGRGRALTMALSSLFDGTQRRSRPARAHHGARLTPRWHAKKVTASARSPWRSAHSSMARKEGHGQRALTMALASLLDGTQRRSRPARARHGARLTPQWHAKKVTASARSPWRSPHSSMASANEDCCRPCNRAPLSPDSNLRASSYVVIASMYLLSP
jgi:hypothetical protein